MTKEFDKYLNWAFVNPKPFKDETGTVWVPGVPNLVYAPHLAKMVEEIVRNNMKASPQSESNNVASKVNQST